MDKYLRAEMRKTSNNKSNPNKNACGLAVAKALCVDDETRYIHTWPDLKRAIGKLWSVRSVKSAVKLKAGGSVGSIRNAIKKHNKAHADCSSYVVYVKGHVLLLDHAGKTIVDTAPVERDNREVLAVYGVYLPTDNMDKMQRLRVKL